MYILCKKNILKQAEKKEKRRNYGSNQFIRGYRGYQTRVYRIRVSTTGTGFP